MVEVEECGHAGIITFLGIAVGQRTRLFGTDLCLVAPAGRECCLPGLTYVLVDALAGIVMCQPGVLKVYLGSADACTRLEGVEDEKRTARFVCAMAVVFPDGSEDSYEATYEGMIGYEEKGPNGFGYDPIFYLPDRGVYSAELDPDEKNRISHRGKALEGIKEILVKHEA